MSRLLTLITLAVVIPLAAVACGSDEEDEAAGGRTVEVVGTEFAFDPANITLDEAGSYTFRLSNEGEVEHALEIEGQDIEEETDVIGGGETAEITVDLAEGEYEMYCPVGNHREMGMEGTVVVGAGGAGGATTGDDDETTTDEDETTTEEGDDDMGY